MKIFLYGTLRYGGSANHLMRGCTLLCDDEVEGTLYDLGHFPGLKLTVKDHDVPPPGVGTGLVKGNVYECPLESSESLLQRLDQYEGYIPGQPDQSLYTRRTVETRGGHSVFVYEYRHPIHPDLCVTTGDWLSK